MARKRAPGGGRKRSPETPRAQLSIRMQENDRAQLEAAAKRRDWTVTEELLWRLRASFARDHERQRDPPLRAWCFLISDLASYIHYETPNWHKNPFWFRAFKLGVTGLLDALEPKGEIRSPKDLDPLIDHKTPEAQATAALNIVLHQLHGGKSRRESRGGPAVIDERLRAEDTDRAAELLDHQLAAALADLDFDREAYAQVRQVLQLKPIWRRASD
jgi:hypothetical protein